jgi:hypothetical protein
MRNPSTLNMKMPANISGTPKAQAYHAPFGWQTETRWQGTIDIARKLGLIETALRPEDIFENTFLSSSARPK